MSTFPGSPRFVKGGIVLLDPDIFTLLRKAMPPPAGTSAPHR
jgi:hypothetical protein